MCDIYVQINIKANGLFWYMAKMKIFFVNAEFYRVALTINALLTVRSEMFPFSGNNQNIKMVRVPPNTLP